MLLRATATSIPLADESVSAIVTDPPYGLEFMGKDWDRFRSDDPGTSRHRGEHAGAIDHNPGGYADGTTKATITYGGLGRPTTSRCTGCGKRDQRQNPHECSAHARWVKELIDPYAAPPSMLAFENWCREWAREALRVLKPGGHLLSFGGTRTYHRLACGIEDAGFEIRDDIGCFGWIFGSGFPKSLNGPWGGTALKPGWEPIIVARKPLAGTVAQNVLAHGTGGINVDAVRLGTEGGHAGAGTGPSGGIYGDGLNGPSPAEPVPGLGRWPANVVFDEAAAAMLDEQAGESRSPGDYLRAREQQYGYGDSGGPSRFFYAAKASRFEREYGLDDLEPARRSDGRAKDIENPRLRTSERRNDHPTVKPIELMRWLVRMVAPPGGIVLDPFCGSGTTGIACALEGVPFIGIDLEPHYLEIAQRRIHAWGNREAYEAARAEEDHQRALAEVEAKAARGEEHQTVMELA